ncbi:MAG TPA: glycosyltransferase [Bacteroidota bacterium]|nr:glycosyltransferase [Bacteroidota bacterium]
MNVLMMFPYAPLPPPNDLGGMKRNIPFFVQMAKRHAVTVLAYGSPEQEKVFRGAYAAMCAGVRFVDRRRPRILNGIEALWLLLTWRSNYRQVYRDSMQEALDELSRTVRFDVIHTCTQMFGYFRFPEGVPVVTDTHEVEYDLAQRTYRNTKNLFWKFFMYLSYRVGRREEIENCARFDALIATTERDAVIFRRDVPSQRVVVIQNGVDPSFYESPRVPREPGALVFTGMMSFYPNTHGIRWFIDEVFPLVVGRVPGARLYVVGKDPGKEIMERGSDRVTVTGFVDDVRPYMARGEVFIIPLHIGGGIRGKALEAMAMRLPIVTTTIGCEGIHLKDGTSALFADTPADFAGAVTRLLDDPALRERITQSALATVRTLYDWDAKGEALDALYRSVAVHDTSTPKEHT